MIKCLAIAIALSACGDDGKAGPVDMSLPLVDFDNGSCGDQLRFTGAIEDWDASEANFCGVNEANVMDGADGGQDTTAPNGRYDLCIDRAPATTALTVTPPVANSQCTTPPSNYAVPAILVATKAIVESGHSHSGRMFTEARKAAFFAEMGIAYDPTKAHVLVFQGGTPKAVSLTAASAPAWANTGTAWAAGATGAYVFFGNVDLGAGSTEVAVAGGAIGTGSIPLAANQLTLVSLYATP